MSTDRTKPTVALLGRIPDDVRAAIQSDTVLLAPDDWTAQPEDRRQGIALALTSAMGGADRQLVEQLPGLRRIASVGAGVDLFDRAWLAARDIDLCPTPEVMTEDTAECAVTLALAAMRNVAANDRFVRRGDWAQARAPLGRRLSGRRSGLSDWDASAAGSPKSWRRLAATSPIPDAPKNPCLGGSSQTCCALPRRSI